VEGIPPVPPALWQTLARYNENRAALLLDWHPTRRELLISTRFGDVPQVHRVGMPGGARRQLTFYPDPVTHAAYDPAAGDSLVFSKDVGGGEFYQLYRLDAASGNTTLLTDGKSRNTSSLWSHHGGRVAFSSTRRNARDTDIYIMNPADTGSAKMLLSVDGGGWAALDWSPDDRSLVVGEYRSINQSLLYLVDAATGDKQMLTPAGERAAYSDAVFSKDGKGLYITTDKDSEFRRLAFLDLGSRQMTFLRPDLKWDVENLDLSEDGAHLAYVVNEDGVSRLHVLDTRTKQDLGLPALPSGLIAALRWHRNGNDLGFTLTSARSPADVYSISIRDGKLERWTESETGGLNAETFVEPELIHWKSFDGRTISGFYYRPPQAHSGSRPVMIEIHGGPEGQSRPGYLARINYFINELGIALIRPNVRGSTGYGKSFLDLDNGIKREDSVKDIGALLDWIAGRKELDAKRVLVTGGSYGGYMTLASMTNFNDRLCCGIDVVGISNFISFLERTEAYRRDLRRVEYGDERDPQIRAFFNRIAPLNNASHITRPMFVVQGKNDPRVPMQESEQMAAAIRKNGGPVWYLLAEDEGHGFAKKRNRDYQFAAEAMFVKQFLLGDSEAR
jgi:dipeptidyl aminopeptidase/acylaminoacyl peptidase